MSRALLAVGMAATTPAMATRAVMMLEECIVVGEIGFSR